MKSSSNPFFSIIIPTYNRASFIAKSIESVLTQSFSDFELIIIDDASMDNTNQVVNGFTDGRITYYKNKTNQERCISRNKGITLAKGKYVCFLDSDDYHLPNHLMKIYKSLKSKDFPKALFFTNAWEEENGIRNERHCPPLEDYNVFHYLLTYTSNPQRWAVHKDIFKKINFDPEVIICEDMDTSLRIATQYPIFQIKDRTTVYVHHPNSFTHGDPRKPYKELFYLKRIFSKPELKGKLPLLSKWRLLSMCYYHIAIIQDRQKNKWKMYSNIIKSFFLFPMGYNGKTNKVLAIMFLYNIPLLGWSCKKAITLLKML